MDGLLEVDGTVVAACAGLFARVRRNEQAHAALEPRLAALERAVAARPAPDTGVAPLRDEMHAFRLHVAEDYVRRADYVTVTSTVLTRLDAMAVMVARIDERVRRGGDEQA